MTKILHSFHIVEIRPWPLLTGLRVLSLTSRIVYWFKFSIINNFLFSFLILILIRFFWWRDVTRESTFQGNHRSLVQLGLKIGIILFIFSEVIFFSGFFWTFIHASLSPCYDIGLIWPPKDILPLNPFQVPLLNTIILLSSGITVTWRHHLILSNKNAQISLFLTIILGGYFTALQGLEYIQASFSLADSIYGRVFFVRTGFHGIHVIIGSCFLFVCLIRLILKNFSFSHNIGYEFAIWYWHFVDVVWLFLFSLIYWWGF